MKIDILFFIFCMLEKALDRSHFAYDIIENMISGTPADREGTLQHALVQFNKVFVFIIFVKIGIQHILKFQLSINENSKWNCLPYAQ